MKLVVRLAMWGGVLGLIVAALVWGLRPQPIEVEYARVLRGQLQVSIREDGRTRIKDRYTVSSPVAGQLVRLKLRPGDFLVANETVLATIQPNDPSMLDVRQIAQAEARVSAAKVSIEKSEARRQQAKALLDLAESQMGRTRQLFEDKSVPREELEAAETVYRSRLEELRVAVFEQEISQFELEQASAALIFVQPDRTSGEFQFEIKSPIDGAVLRVFQESATVVVPGLPLLEIGNPSDLEIVIDVLSQDAVRIKPGQKVMIEEWGGTHPLSAQVRLVEPAAFTKISALGVEEQRVNVVADFDSSNPGGNNLGDAYRVEASIIVGQSDDSIKVPNSALFRINGDWFVFTVRESKAVRHSVQIGLRSERETEIVEGLSVDEIVIVYPSDLLDDGTLVRLRELPLR
ncbi:MAG TPA: HlyD family efflux transporter periplasmic adaptor subunit [Pirellulaceae bacterium]|nr:HlyD family efflux transporter periplasmic adaptor subunit [Pirellulaceae bacterium]